MRLGATLVLLACLTTGCRDGTAHTAAGTLRLDLQPGEALRVRIEQGTADLALLVEARDSSPRRIDMRERGPESATLIADRPTTYVITARSAEGRIAALDIAIERPTHLADEKDRHTLDAERLESSGKTRHAERQFAAALQPLVDALALWTTAGDPVGIATTQARIGDVQLGSGRFAEAEQAYRRALRHPSILALPYQRASVENNLGVLVQQQGLPQEAQQRFATAMSLWRQLPGMDSERASTEANEGALLLEAGDMHAALERLLAAELVLGPSASPNARAQLPALLNNLGVAYRGLGNLDAAEQYFARAVSLVPARSRPSTMLEVRLAQIALARGNLADAEQRAQGARESVHGLATPDASLRGNVAALLGEIYAASNRLPQALSAFDEAQSAYGEINAARGVATAWHHRGVIERRLRRWGPSRRSLEQALEIRHRIGLLDPEADTQYELGLLALDQNDPATARVHLESSTRLLETVRGRVAGDYSRAAYFAARQRYYAALIEALMQLHHRRPADGYLAAAFDASERARARALIDALRESGATPPGDDDRTLWSQLRQQQRLLDFWAGRVARAEGVSGAALAAAQQATVEHLTRYRQIEARISASAASRVGGSPTVFPLATIQRHVLDSQTRLLRIMLGEHRSFAWLVGPDSIEVATLAPGEAIETAARSAIDVLHTAPTQRPEAIARRGRTPIQEISTLILSPFAGQLATHRLLIVADGQLQRVPFAALIEPGTDDALITRHELAVVPSASALLVLRQHRAARAGTAAGIAVVYDPVYESDDPRLMQVGGPLPTAGDEQLGDAGVSVDRLMQTKAFGDWLLKRAPWQTRFGAAGFKAHRDVLARLGNFRTLHLDVHAFADDRQPELSALVLSRWGTDRRRRYGLLRAHDIGWQLDLRADLVVLSACSGASGLDMPGEGLMGLARGFFGAGAGAIVASLNTVQEEATVELMKSLYEELLAPSRPRRPIAALRAAQLRLMQDPRFADPFYWSLFVLMGDPQ